MSRALALQLMDWHGGQWSALYSVGSCMFAGAIGSIKREAVADALRELKRCHDHVTTKPAQKRELKRLAKQLKGWWKTRHG